MRESVLYYSAAWKDTKAVFGGIISLSGKWMLLCKELIMAAFEDSSPITMQELKTF